MIRGQKNMSVLHKGDRTNLEICPNLWAGVGLVRGGCVALQSLVTQKQ